jgi:hypothetical protein
VVAYFWGEDGNVLKIETQWLLSDGSPRFLRPGAKVTAQLDTDGYTSMLLNSAKAPHRDVAPILHMVMVVRWTNSHSVNCVETDLPQYQELDQKPTLPLQFQPAHGFPALPNWTRLMVQTENLPNAAWGPPALLRNQGDERTTYTYFLNPAKQR